jgi:hypothetical protein
MSQSNTSVTITRKPLLRFDNASDTAPAKFIAYYLLGAGEERLIEMLER